MNISNVIILNQCSMILIDLSCTLRKKILMITSLKKAQFIRGCHVSSNERIQCTSIQITPEINEFDLTKIE